MPVNRADRQAGRDIQVKVKSSDNQYLEDSGKYTHTHTPLAGMQKCPKKSRVNASETPSIKTCETISSICCHHFLKKLSPCK